MRYTQRRKTVLVVDDKVEIFRSLVPNFEQLGWNATYAASTADAVRLARQQDIVAVVLDVVLGNEDGLEVLRQIREFDRALPIIMITGYANVENAVQSMRLGASDFVRKPIDFEELVKTIENSLPDSWKRGAEDSLVDHTVSGSIKTQNERMRSLIGEVHKIAPTELPVLITGENGTGKELIADLIHEISDRSNERIVKVNCAAFPESLLDNELFGHEKGAYTGANSVFRGVFERASGSTLFLDEIGDMSLPIQAKILRVLQNQEIRRLGGDTTHSVNVRFIAATNKNLESLIFEGRFREDLYYRLNAVVLSVPPLRDHIDDVPLLADHFGAMQSEYLGFEFRGFAEETIKYLTSYDWPGNVRELSNVVSYAAAISYGERIEPHHLPASIFSSDDVRDDKFNRRDDVERSLIERALRRFDYNKKRTAEYLGISRKTLYSRMRKFGIQT